MEAIPMSCYSLVEVYEIVSSLDTNITNIEDFCMSSMRLNYEPSLSLVFKDSLTMLGYVMVGLNGNRAFVINYKIPTNYSTCLSLFLNYINKQKENFPKLELLKIIVSKDSPLSEHLEDIGFVCQRLLNSYELNPHDLEWKENPDIRLVKEKVSSAKMRKLRIKESAPLLVPSCFSEDDLIFRDKYYRIHEKSNVWGGGYFVIDKGFIKQLFILPSCRRKGFATSVIKNYYCQVLKSSNIPIRFEYVDTSYEPMLALLRNLGFDAYSVEDKEFVKSLK